MQEPEKSTGNVQLRPQIPLVPHPHPHSQHNPARGKRFCCLPEGPEWVRRPCLRSFRFIISSALALPPPPGELVSGGGDGIVVRGSSPTEYPPPKLSGCNFLVGGGNLLVLGSVRETTNKTPHSLIDYLTFQRLPAHIHNASARAYPDRYSDGHKHAHPKTPKTSNRFRSRLHNRPFFMPTQGSCSP